MAWRGPVESMGRLDVEFDVVMRAARRAGVRLVELHGNTILLHFGKGRRVAGQHGMGNRAPVPVAGAAPGTSRRQRSARRAADDVLYARREAKRQQQQLRGGSGSGGQQAAGMAAAAVAAAPKTVEAAAQAAARRVRWAPVLAATRAVEVPAVEVQLKQQAWQAIKAGKPAAEAAADAEDAMELEAQAEAEAAEARRAVRAESGKRQAVAGTPDEAAQAQAGMAGVEARSWAAVAAGGSGATRTPAGKRAQHISRPSAGVTRPTTRAAATAATAAVAGMGRELQRAWRAAQGAKAA